VRRFADYGKLSGRRLDDLQAGASGRVEGDDEVQKKKDPFDFALWKAAKPGEPSWDSPWGQGRPGWHIECSAMVRDRLGDTIDIHAGGNDLVFPHHENEIAQSEAATGQPLARYWLHNGMVNVDGEKMSKSLGNFTTIRGMLDAPNAPDPMAVRLFVMQAHYRKPIDFTADGITAAQNGWQTLKEGLLFGHEFGDRLGWQTHSLEFNTQNSAIDSFQTAMDDDFNTAGGLAVLFDLAKELRREGNLLVHQGKIEADPATLYQQWQTLVTLAGVLGLEAEPDAAPADTTGLSDAEIEALIQQRQDARQAKNWAESDRLRDELQAQGITLIDQKGSPTRWHRS
jgi:cysteinyl-tRNA synthetase